MPYFLVRPLANYTEIASNGDIIIETSTFPSFINNMNFKPPPPPPPPPSPHVIPLNDYKYRNYDSSFRYENRTTPRYYGRCAPEIFYRTSNQDYGGHKPMTPSLPPIYRPLRHGFTDMLQVGRDHCLRSSDSSTSSLPSIWSTTRTLPTSVGKGCYHKHTKRRFNK